MRRTEIEGSRVRILKKIQENLKMNEEQESLIKVKYRIGDTEK